MKERLKRIYEDFGGFPAMIRLMGITSLFTLLFFLDFIGAWNDVGRANLNGWIGAFLPSFAYACTFVSLSLLLPVSISRIFYSVTAGWIFLFAIISIVTQQNFGMVFRGETLMIMLGSSWSEIREFLAMYARPTWIVGVVLFVALDVLMIALLARFNYFARSRAAGLIAVMLFVPWAIWTAIYPPTRNALTPSLWAMIKSCSVISRIASFSVFESACHSYRQVHELVMAVNNPELPEYLPCKTDDVLLVVVLGESATRNRLSLYGYEKDTTPYMRKRIEALYVFKDLVAPAPGTTQALRYLLTAATIENPEEAKYVFPSICDRAGYDCCFLSNQDHWGSFDGVDAIFFKDCKIKHWIGDEVRVEDPTRRYDELLLPYVECALRCNGKNAIFIHTQGSHSEASHRYPSCAARFGLDESGSLKGDATKSEHYDNSIAYTDYILDEMLKMLEKRGGSSLLVYLSDHGESPSSEYWRYAPDKDLWEVPMFIWMSEEYKAKYPEIVEQIKKSVNKPLVSDQLLFGFTRLFLIDGLPDYKEEEDFLSDKFVPRAKRYNDNVENVE